MVHNELAWHPDEDTQGRMGRSAAVNLRRWVWMVGALLFSAVPICALVDRDGDGVSDIWAALYPEVGGPAADPDGDMVVNRDEAAAGTNPLDAASRLAVKATRDGDGRYVLQWPSVVGKRYCIERSADLATWIALDGSYDGTGEALIVPVTDLGVPLPAWLFWRVVVSDLDSDGDGLNDWEELENDADPLRRSSANDGIPDGWKVVHGFAPADSSIATQDPDGDGRSNLEEYHAGSDPMDYYNGFAPTLVPLVARDGTVGDLGLVSVVVRNAAGDILANAPLDFAVDSGCGLGTVPMGEPAASVRVRTDDNGIAKAYVTFKQEGRHVLHVTSHSGATATQLVFAVAPLLGAVDFESEEGFSVGPIDAQNGWVAEASSCVVGAQEAYSGNRSLVVDQAESRAGASMPFPVQSPDDGVIYVDFYAKPVAGLGAPETATVFDVGGARMAYCSASNEVPIATLEVFDGKGGDVGCWLPTNGTRIWSPLERYGNWIRLTVRLDYSRQCWDLYEDGRLVATQVVFASAGTEFPRFFGVLGSGASALVDHIRYSLVNPVIPDLNNNGIDDDWEVSYGLGLAVDSSSDDLSGGGLTVAQCYLAGCDPHDFFRGNTPAISLIEEHDQTDANGMVSISIKNAEGVLYANRMIVVKTTDPRVRLSESAEGGAGISIRTDGHGVARVALSFNGATSDQLQVELPGGPTLAGEGALRVQNPGFPIFFARQATEVIEKIGRFQYQPSTPDRVYRCWEWRLVSKRAGFWEGEPPVVTTVKSGTLTDGIDGGVEESGDSSYIPRATIEGWCLWNPGARIWSVVVGPQEKHTFGTSDNGEFSLVEKLSCEYSTAALLDRVSASALDMPVVFEAVPSVSMSHGLDRSEYRFTKSAADFTFEWNPNRQTAGPRTARWIEKFTEEVLAGEEPVAPTYEMGGWSGLEMESPIVHFAPPTGKLGTYEIIPVFPDLAVDANRDGQIKLASEDDSDGTSADKPFRFWLNDDNDASLTAGDAGEEVVGSSTKDWWRNVPGCQRDLEDFARLWISTQGLNAALKNGDMFLGLKWEVTSGALAIKVFPAVETDGATAYLTDASSGGVAERQDQQYAVIDERYAGEDPNNSTHTTVGGTDVFVLPKTLFANLSEAQSKTFLLFEGCGVGKGQLKLVILDKNMQVIGEGPGVWMDLKNIKSMYERVKATADGAENFPFPYNFVGSDAVPSPAMGWVSDPSGYSFEPASDERSAYIVFVHGWNMEYSESTNYAETMFKRMWQRGYKGRFVSFRWPTFTGLTTFNDSEYRAWKCGVSLKQYIATLPTSFTVNLVAHSMGNIVAGSALEKGASVANYALLNAAVPAICYDTTGNVVQTSWRYVTPNDDPDPATVASSYQGRLEGVSGNLVNFFLPADSALSAWELNNELFRPHQWPEGSIDHAGYGYQRTAGAGQKLRVVRVAGNRFLGLPDEAMAFAVQAPSLTVGADGRTRGSITEWVDLSTYGFDNVHSAEFLFTIQQTRNFYGTILLKLGVAIQP